MADAMMRIHAIRRRAAIASAHVYVRIGPTGSIGVLAIVAAIVLTVTAVLPVRADLVRLRAQAHQAATHVGGSVLNASIAPTASRPLVSRLPTLNEVSPILVDVMKQARERQLDIKSAEYRWMRADDRAPAQYEMQFDVHGGYVAIRQCLQTLLNEHGALALREVAFTRNKDSNSPVRARVRLVVFVAESAT